MNAEYQKEHAVCPQCGLPPAESTYEAYLEPPDLNKVSCICGWSGVTHDLVPRRAVKILVVGAGSFGPYSRDELIAEILKEHPDAEIVTQDSSEPGAGLAYDFVAFDEAAKLKQTLTLELRPSAYISASCLDTPKRGRRRGQRRKDSPWRQ